MKTIKFVEIIDKYLNIPYKLGGKTPEEGMDCLSLIYYFYKEVGCDISYSFKDFDMGSYVDRWKNGEGRQELIDYVCSFGEEIDKNFRSIGNIILIKAGDIVPCIYIGNGNILMMVDNKGTLVLPLESVDVVKFIKVF